MKEKKLLVVNKKYFLYKKINAGHIASNYSNKKGTFTSFTQAVKGEEVSIIDSYIVYYAISESETKSNSYLFVCIITIVTKIQQSTVSARVDPATSINIIFS